MDEGSLIANNCRFINNKSQKTGGAICSEDGGTVELNNCYFNGNKVNDEENDFSNYGSSTDDCWTFNDCLFEGHGSLDVEENPLQRQVDISPDIEDTVDYAVLYKDGEIYARKSCKDGETATFGDDLETLLDPRTYTVYMVEGDAYSIKKDIILINNLQL